MRVTLVCVGRARGPLASAIEAYEARAARYWKIEVAEVEAGAGSRKAAPGLVTAAEADRILARLPAGDVLPLTRGGDPIDSAGLAELLAGRALHASPGVSFVVGGAFGLDPAVLARSSRRLSLSALTFPHDLARLVLLEQLYRAGTILRGEPYHKG
jgi:23S rRNA (pseudouridine1915-N3)-methyltransferase